MINDLFGTLFFIFCIGFILLIAFIILLIFLFIRKKMNECTFEVIGTCIDYEKDSHHVSSNGGVGSKWIDVYMPIFRIEFNGTIYDIKTFKCWTDLNLLKQQVIVGYNYPILINPNNINQCVLKNNNLNRGNEHWEMNLR